MVDRPLSIDIRHPLVLKSNELAVLMREDGEIPEEIPGFGMFYRDTCWLSHYALRLHDDAPLWLSSSDEQGFAAHIDLTNKAMKTVDGRSVKTDKLHLQRTVLLTSGPAGSCATCCSGFLSRPPLRLAGDKRSAPERSSPVPTSTFASTF